MASSSDDVVTACHILIKHKDSRRPASQLDPDGVRIKNTTIEKVKSVARSLSRRTLC